MCARCIRTQEADSSRRVSPQLPDTQAEPPVAGLGAVGVVALLPEELLVGATGVPVPAEDRTSV